MRGAYDVNDHSLTAVLQHASLDLRGCVQEECPSGKWEEGNMLDYSECFAGSDVFYNRATAADLRGSDNYATREPCSFFIDGGSLETKRSL
jgi:hypothetical protein